MTMFGIKWLKSCVFRTTCCNLACCTERKRWGVHRIDTVWCQATLPDKERVVLFWKFHLRKTPLFFEFSLCLSRACLGKMFVYIYKWRKKWRFLHRAEASSDKLEVRHFVHRVCRGLLAWQLQRHDG
jgi:hypothetical protein